MKDKKNVCKVDGCKRKAVVLKHSLCKTHSTRYYRTGDVGEGKIRKRIDHKIFTGGKMGHE